MKVMGAELKQWFDEAWPGIDWYVDGGDAGVDLDRLDLARRYDTAEIGGVFYQGKGDDPTGGDGYDLAALIRKWRKTKTHDTLVVTLPKARVAEFKALVKSFGGSVK